MLRCLTPGQSRAFIPSSPLQDFAVALGFQFKMEWLSSSHVPPFPKMFGANMGEVIRFIPKSDRERARLVREARARYDSIFPPADPAREQRDNTPVSHTVNDSNANRSDGSLVS
jgi:hypothetical protein